ncbi:hypothetical protein [Sphaerospermopsis reniformis]|uniref:hypothetical protein n=1 Tax=Sphaerospermopsis reniformis TaxID=531300 RepID=UPI001396C2EB|nr:hypothetical protein [Sphaerospermopsis reniformis]
MDFTAGHREQGRKRFFPVTNHQSPITSHQSPVTNHQSPITNHQSPITSHLFPHNNPNRIKPRS